MKYFQIRVTSICFGEVKAFCFFQLHHYSNSRKDCNYFLSDFDVGKIKIRFYFSRSFVELL